MKKRFGFIALLLAVLCTVGLTLLTTDTQAAEELASGTCGDNLTWVLDDSGTLTISGTGDMEDCRYSGAPWYSNRSDIQTVVIEYGVTSISTNAFYGCTNLTSVNIADSVSRIDDFAFEWCSVLTNVTIPSSVNNIGYGLFNACSSLTAILVDPDNSYYCSDEYGVLYNKAQTELIAAPCTISDTYVIPDSVTSIENYAFYDCDLSSIILPDNLTSIGKAAFNWSDLTSITIPESVTSIGDYAFSACWNLSNVYYLSDIAAWCEIEFGGREANPLCWGDNLYIKGEMVKELVIPDSVTSISDYAFLGCNSITSVIIPDGVISIGNHAFAECNSITSVIIPGSVISIGEDSFEDCDSLAYNTYDNAYYLGNSENPYLVLIQACDRNITSCTIHEDTKIICSKAFSYCSSLTGVTIFDSVISIGEDAFDGCGSLIYNTYDNAHYLGNLDNPYVVLIEANDTSITSCNIHEETKLVCPYAFCYCTSLENVTIPDSVTSIGSCAFYGCPNLTSITMGKGISRIGENAFGGSTSLTDVYISDIAAWCMIEFEIGERFEEGNANPLHCGGYLYINGEMVTELVIPDSVTCIRDYAFYNCRNRLTSIVIPDSVTRIGDCAFYSFGWIGAIFFEGDAPSFGSDVFYWVHAIAYYPIGNDTWTENVMQNYGGTITWKPICSGAHSYQTTVTEPTCTSWGCTTYTCSVCGYSYSDSHVEALGHQSVVVDEQEATCAAPGYVVYYCERCDSTYREEIIIEHSYENGICSACGRKIKIENAKTGQYGLSDLQAGDDGIYRTPDGAKVYIAIDNLDDGGIQVWLGGNTLEEYVDAYGNEYFDLTYWEDLKALMDDSGYVLLTDESLHYLTVLITGNPAWGESEEHIPYYLFYDYPEELPHEHIYVGEVTVEPTCTASGMATYTCSVCGESFTEELAALGHTYETVVTAPTCTAGGYTTYTCSTCGDSYVGDEIAALGHDMSAWAQTKVPTCTEKGEEQSACSRCDHVETREVEALGHNEVTDAAVAPTCTATGLTEGKHCDRCDEILIPQTEVPATGHSFGEWYTVTEPGEYEDGLEQRDCANCDHSETRAIPAVGHTHSYEAVVTAPTCTENGYTTYTCRCGDSYVADEVPALGHNYTSVVTAPSCTEKGYTTHTCANCGASYTSDEVAALGHSWDDGIITREPTVEAEGEKTYTCTTCGETRTEILPKKEPVIYDTPEDDSVQIPENDCFEGGTTVTVEKVEEGEIFDQVANSMKNRAESYTVFEFTAVKDGEAVQPNGKLTVSFAIPADYSTNVALYYMDERGNLTKLEIVIDTENRTATVELEHFSTYILTDEDTAPSVIPGDANGDGKVNARDARLILRYAAMLITGDEIDQAAADFNGDGKVNARDARAVLRVAAGLN